MNFCPAETGCSHVCVYEKAKPFAPSDCPGSFFSDGIFASRDGRRHIYDQGEGAADVQYRQKLTNPNRVSGVKDGDVVEFVLSATVVNAVGGPGIYFNIETKADSGQIETCDTRLKSTQQLQQCPANNRRAELMVHAIKLK